MVSRQKATSSHIKREFIPAHTFTSQRRALEHRRRTRGKRTPTAAELARIEGRDVSTVGFTRRSAVQVPTRNAAVLEREGSPRAKARVEIIRSRIKTERAATRSPKLRQKARQETRKLPRGTEATDVTIDQGYMGRSIHNVRVDSEGGLYAPISEPGINDLGYNAKQKDIKVSEQNIIEARRNKLQANINKAGGVYAYSGQQRAKKYNEQGGIVNFLKAEATKGGGDILQDAENRLPNFDTEAPLPLQVVRVMPAAGKKIGGLVVGGVVGSAVLGYHGIRGLWNEKSRNKVTNTARDIVTKHAASTAIDIALVAPVFETGGEVLGKKTGKITEKLAESEIFGKIFSKVEQSSRPFRRISEKQKFSKSALERASEFSKLDEGTVRVKIGEPKLKVELEAKKNYRMKKEEISIKPIIKKQSEFMNLETYGKKNFDFSVEPTPKKSIEIKIDLPKKLGKKAQQQVSIIKTKPKYRERLPSRIEEVNPRTFSENLIDTTRIMSGVRSGFGIASRSSRSLGLGIAFGAVGSSFARTNQFRGLKSVGRSFSIGRSTSLSVSQGLSSITSSAKKQSSKSKSSSLSTSLAVSSAVALGAGVLTSKVKQGKSKSSKSVKTRPGTYPRLPRAGGIPKSFGIAGFGVSTKGRKQKFESPSLAAVLGGFKGIKTSKLPIVTGLEIRGI